MDSRQALDWDECSAHKKVYKNKTDAVRDRERKKARLVACRLVVMNIGDNTLGFAAVNDFSAVKVMQAIAVT